jgi:hypothetical protein
MNPIGLVGLGRVPPMESRDYIFFGGGPAMKLFLSSTCSKMSSKRSHEVSGDRHSSQTDKRIKVRI